MSVEAIFEGGPAHNEQMALIGSLPSYVMLMRNPSPDSMPWLIVGAGFDDNWPDSHRYVLDLERTHLLMVGDLPSGEAIYVYKPQ